jgi:DNA-directed RNA polymerase specialized sigma24 family protein
VRLGKYREIFSPLNILITGNHFAFPCISNFRMVLDSIIEGCKHQERVAQKILYNRYVGTLYRLSLRYVGVVNDAEDCTSEAFVKIFEKLQSFDYKEINSFETWIKQIVINQSLMCLRRRGSLMMTE